MRRVGVTVLVGGIGESENVTQAFQPDGRSEMVFVAAGLCGKPLHIRGRLLVVRLQDFGLLFRRRERGLQPVDSVLNGAGSISNSTSSFFTGTCGLAEIATICRAVTSGVTSTTRPVTVTRPDGVR